MRLIEAMEAVLRNMTNFYHAECYQGIQLALTIKKQYSVVLNSCMTADVKKKKIAQEKKDIYLTS